MHIIFIGQSSVNDHHNIEQFMLYNGYTRVETVLIQLYSPPPPTTATTTIIEHTDTQLQLHNDSSSSRHSELLIHIFVCFSNINLALTYYIINTKYIISNTLINKEKILVLGHIFSDFLGGHNSDPSSTTTTSGGGIDIRLCESLLKLIINISTLLRNSPHTMMLYELFLSYKDNSDCRNVPLITYLSQIGQNPLFRLVYIVYVVCIVCVYDILYMLYILYYIYIKCIHYINFAVYIRIYHTLYRICL